MNRAARTVAYLNRLAAKWKYGQERKRGLEATTPPAALPAETLEARSPEKESTS